MCACGRQKPADGQDTTAPEEETAAPAEETLTLPYTSLDSVNPFYTASLLNASLIPLAYQSLYCLDSGFMPVRVLAAEETPTPDSVRVTLADDVVFSDGAPLTGADVVYSFEKAKASSLYGESLRNIESCTADGNYTLTFTLHTPDCNAVNLLTFPVVRADTAEDADRFPVGSGCFVFTADSLRLSLVQNARFAGARPRIGTVRLYDITDNTSLMHLLDTGEIDGFYTDLSEGVAKRSFSGASEIYLNNLVFLGFNYASYRLSSADVRRAVSLAVSRGSICANAFLGHARAAFFPMNTSWDALASLRFSAEQTGDADPAAADALLDTVGAGFSGDTLSYRLICVDEGNFMPTAAALIAEQLESVNINLSVELLTEEAFRAALAAGDYDLYLSEIKLAKNMDLSPFFDAGGAASYGIDPGLLSVDGRYGLYRADRLELQTFLNDFYAEMPFVPLAFRNGQFCYSRGMNSGVEATEDNLFLNIADWSAP